MKRCSQKAFAKCPTSHLCLGDASFCEGSECDKFNQLVNNEPITNGDRIRAMSNDELANFLDSLILPGYACPSRMACFGAPFDSVRCRTCWKRYLDREVEG